MNHPPVLSVIIPTFNSASTIGKCLASLQEQTFRDFEILIMDGGSQDDTLKTVAEFQTNNNFLTVRSAKDQGTYDAMNKGITLSTGTWLYFLGSDDWLYNDHVLRDVFSNVENMDYDILYGNVYRTGLQATYDGPFSEEKLIYKNICHQAIFFRKSIFGKTGYYNINYKVLADWDHNFKWFYNPEIKKKFIELVISNYNDKGLSGIEEDEVFQADKFLNLYHYAYNNLNPSMRKGVIKLVIYTYGVRKRYVPAFRFLISFTGRYLKTIFKRKAISF